MMYLTVLLAAVAASCVAAEGGAWSSANNTLLFHGMPVVLHGLGTTCTEYLLRGIGMECWANNNFGNPANVITKTNDEQVAAITTVLATATQRDQSNKRHKHRRQQHRPQLSGPKAATASPRIMPVVRIPMTASYWLNVSTNASAANRARFPNLSSQYQTLITKLVANYTSRGIITILDLHWNDDDTEQQPMALRRVRPDGGTTGDSVEFWDSLASRFGGNELVFYELYNEPHLGNTSIWLHGNDQYTGMLEMAAAVRKHSSGVLVVAGASGWAYDAASLLQLDAVMADDTALLFNFHPYMGPAQAGSTSKCPAGVSSMLAQVEAGSDRPMIFTEFGQTCCATHGTCEHCAQTGNSKGYDETLLDLALAHGVSWLPWAWRPAASNKGSGGNCQDLNGGNPLSRPHQGKGADFDALWKTYAHKG
eukprot:m.138240 g.138240  ORF g.138240 m.138240 type:complete len:423 (-) comp17021_c0_seq1:8-1276(-)